MHTLHKLINVHCALQSELLHTFHATRQTQLYALCTLLSICMQTIWLLSCHTRLLHNHGPISLQKGFERTGDWQQQKLFSSPLHSANVRCSPQHQRQAHWMYPKCFRHERKWQWHLPSMLIKSEQFSIPNCCLGDFFLD